MFYNASDVAMYIINKCYIDKNPISNLKLQKVLYFTWVDYFKTTRRILFFDKICAWQFGPVVPEVYYEFCSYGGKSINMICDVPIEANDKLILDDIIKYYEDIPVNILVDKTHQSGTAWDKVYDEGNGNRKEIPFNMIKELECGEVYAAR